MSNSLLILVAITLLFLGGHSQTGQCTTNTFRIQGNGQVTITPDIAVFSISASGTGKTAAIALAGVNSGISAILAAFKTLGIPSGNYSTSTITIYDIYNYSTNPYTITGSQAQQTLQLTVGTSSNIATLLNTLSKIPAVTVQSIVFDLKDRSGALQKARLAAFADAKNKFAQYLSLTGEKNLGLLKITDMNSDVYTTYNYSPSSFSLISILRVKPTPVQVYASVSVTWRVSG
jgi:uncharacterized protein YggE